MQHTIDPRLVEVPEEQRALLTELVKARGIVEACRVSRLGRSALLGVIGRGLCLPGSAALLREADGSLRDAVGRLAAGLGRSTRGVGL